jgi:ribonuclease T
MMANEDTPDHPMKNRFRGYYPVVIDVETGGLDPEHHALLEIAAITLTLNDQGQLIPYHKQSISICPYDEEAIVEEAIKINKIDIHDPNRGALEEKQALTKIFQMIRKDQKEHQCVRSVLVGHNAAFDLNFVHQGAKRCGIKRNPLHPFTCFDTATLAAVAYGQTVLKLAIKAIGLEYNDQKAHRALYDTELTSALFCAIANQWPQD